MCVTGKKEFESKKEAVEYISTLRLYYKNRKTSEQKASKKYSKYYRAYCCNFCDYWHITSKEEWEHTEDVDLIYKEQFKKLINENN